MFSYVTGLCEDEFGYASLEELANVQGKFGIGIEIEVLTLPQPILPLLEKKAGAVEVRSV